MRASAQQPEGAAQSTITEPAEVGRTPCGQSPDAHSILHLQRTVGNRAVQRLLRARSEDPAVGARRTPNAAHGKDGAGKAATPARGGGGGAKSHAGALLPGALSRMVGQTRRSKGVEGSAGA